MIKTYEELEKAGKPIKGYETHYVTKDGYIYSCINNARNRRKNPLLLVGGKDRDGYQLIGLKNKTFKVHRLVAEAFIPNPLNKEQVNHIDGNKSNNCVSNLEWNTPSENVQHAFATGLNSQKQAGEHHSSKLTDSEYICLIEDLIAGMTNSDAGSKYGLHPRYVSLVRHKKRVKSIWNQYFNGESADKSNGVKLGYDLEKMDNVVREAILTDKSNAQIGRELDVDPSQISRIRHKKPVMMKKYGELINKYEKLKNLSATTIESTND